MFFYDSSPSQGEVFYYRVTELRPDGGGVIRETPLAATEQVGGRVLPYRENVLPPPQGFKAWAPTPATSVGDDAKGIAFRWCETPAATGGDSLPTISEYHIYQSRTGFEAFRLLAKISPACLAMNSGEPAARCVITSDNACLQADEITPKLPCNRIDPDPSGCTGAGCVIIDKTANGWPAINTSPSWQHDNYDYTFFVTAVGSDSATESVPSNHNQGWLNYCSGSSCEWRREPDGDGEFLWRDPVTGKHGGVFVCGEEDVKLTVPEEIQPIFNEPEPDALRLARIEGALYRTIGTDPDIPHQYLFYHLDHLGSPRVILDASGSVVSKHHYLPFGEEKETLADPSTNTKSFTGHERDQETGVDYMLARYYSSSLGRFMAVDPGESSVLENPQSWNLYAYVLNNPIRDTDPDGRCPTDPNPPSPAQTLGQKVMNAISSSVQHVLDSGSIIGSGQTMSGQQATPMQSVDAVVTVVSLSAAVIGTASAIEALPMRAGATTATEGAAARGGTSAGSEANSAASGLKLQKSLASEAQMGESGGIMAGPGGKKPFRNAGDAAAKHGGEAGDYVKKSSSSYTAKDGTTFETHWVENTKTGARTDYKTKLNP